MQMQLGRFMVQELDVAGGHTDSIFPRVELWLNRYCDHYNSLKSIASRKDMDRYWSVVDFVFVEMNPSYRRSCLAYYADKGAPLREIITESQRAAFETRMLRLLIVAYEAFCAKRRMSWSGALAVVDGLAA